MQVRIGDKIVEAEMKNGVPTVQARSETIKHPDGRVDVTVYVPCIQLNAKAEGVKSNG